MTKELGFKNLPVRFFIYDEEATDNYSGDPGDLRECDEADFLASPWPIEYERHTVHANGCAQICLTKMPRG